MNRLRLVLLMCSTLFMLGVLGCGDENGEHAETFVTIQGRVDTGAVTTPMPNANCQFVQRNGQRLHTSTTDANGVFQLHVRPESQGFIGCHPPAFGNLVLTTFVSTVGAVAGATLPAQGVEEVSPAPRWLRTLLRKPCRLIRKHASVNCWRPWQDTMWT